MHAGLADVEVNFSGRAADVAEVGVGHFAGAVDDTTHDRELHSFDVSRLRADELGGRLKVEQGAAATGSGDELGLGGAGAGALKDIIGEGSRPHGIGFGFNADQIAEPIAK